MFVKSNVGLCVRESGRSVSALVGVTPIVPERVPVSKEQQSNLLIGESSYSTGIIDADFVYGMFASHIFDLLTTGIIIKALWFQIEGEMNTAHLLREYIDNPGPVGWFPVVKDKQFNSPEMIMSRITGSDPEKFEIEISNFYGELVVKEVHSIPVPYSVRTGKGLNRHERERVLLEYAAKHPPVTQPIQTLCSLRQEPAMLTKVVRHYEAAKQEGITMYCIS